MVKKVGILTYHHAINYGATLQGYALWQTVKKQGYDVEFIDYRPLKALKNYFVNRYFFGNLIKSTKLEGFLNSYTKLGSTRAYTASTLQSLNLTYDIVIAGSDEVWNINSFRGFDTSYFLEFISNNNIKHTTKISYAPSFGSTKTLGMHRDKISELLKQFAYISVRDSNSLSLLREECQCEAIQVFDPTLLADYSEITSSINYDSEYLLIYSFGLNPEEENLVRLLAKSKNLTIVSVGFYNEIADKNLVNISIEEWLGYFSKASYIVTSFFHGNIFSIIFRKPFTALSRGDKSIKVSDLLNTLDLESRIFYSNSDINKFSQQNLELDYTPILDKLAAGISHSRKFFVEALNG